MVELSTRLLPEDRPRYLMGVGHPEDLVAAMGLGVDLFDCVYPTRTGRFGSALVPEGRLNLKNARFLEDRRPLEEGCDCYTCQTFGRAYLAHLVRAGEMLGGSSSPSTTCATSTASPRPPGRPSARGVTGTSPGSSPGGASAGRCPPGSARPWPPGATGNTTPCRPAPAWGPGKRRLVDRRGDKISPV